MRFLLLVLACGFASVAGAASIDNLYPTATYASSYLASTPAISGAVTGFADGVCTVTINGHVVAGTISGGFLSFDAPSNATTSCYDVTVAQTTPTSVSATWTVAGDGGFCYRTGFSNFGLHSLSLSAVYGQGLLVDVAATAAGGPAPSGVAYIYPSADCSGPFLTILSLNGASGAVSGIPAGSGGFLSAWFPGDSTYLDTCSNAVPVGGTSFVHNTATYEDSLGPITITQASTSTILLASAELIEPSGSVTFTATVSAVAPGAGTPSGSVTFYDGAGTSTPLCSGVVLSGGQAQCATTALTAVAMHTVHADYAGGSNFVASSGSYDVFVRYVPTVAVATTPTPSHEGDSVTITATVGGGGGAGTGTVDFSSSIDGSLGTANVVGGVATVALSSLTVGTHTILATYSGDSNYFDQDGSVTHVVNVASTPTSEAPTVTLVQDTATGPDVVFTVTVSGGSGEATGNVTVTSGSDELGNGTLSAGSVTISVSGLAVGAYDVVANYAGDVHYFEASSAALHHEVSAAGGTTGATTGTTTGTTGATTGATGGTTGSSDGGTTASTSTGSSGGSTGGAAGATTGGATTVVKKAACQGSGDPALWLMVVAAVVAQRRRSSTLVGAGETRDK